MYNISKQPSPRAQELLNQTRRRMLGPYTAERLWERNLNATDRKLLGRSLEHVYQLYPSAAQIWARFKRIKLSAAVIEVAEILNFLTPANADWLRREWGELPSDPAEAMQVAIERGDLVLSLREHTLHWNKHEFEIPFAKHPALWDFLVTVCHNAKKGESVGCYSFGGEKGLNYVTQTKSKLSQLAGFPIDLIDLFESAGPKRQRLNLAPERIHLFD